MGLENVEIKSASGIVRGRLSGNLSNPRASLMCLHGGPGGDFHGNTNIFDQIANLASSMGYCTLQYSIFGAQPSDGSPEDITISSQTADFFAVLKYFKNRYQCPIHLVGESAGATIVSMNWQSDILSNILLWPAFDLADTDLGPYLEEKWRSEARNKGHINDSGVILGSEMIEEIIATDFSNSFNLPEQDVFIAHGQADVEVPYEQSLRAIRAARGRLMFVSHPSADHGFKEQSQRKYLLNALKTWLLVYE